MITLDPIVLDCIAYGFLLWAFMATCAIWSERWFQFTNSESLAFWFVVCTGTGAAIGWLLP